MRILRYDIPADDQWHEVPLTGGVVSVGSRVSGVVEFWATADIEPAVVGRFRVFGTGQRVDVPGGKPVVRGTTFDAASPLLVWHLVQAESLY